MLYDRGFKIRFVKPSLMDSFEIIIKEETFRIIRSGPENDIFSVFNHATCHIIKKNSFGIWKSVEHRFGTDSLPIDEVGEAIEKHYKDFDAAAGNAPQLSEF